MSGSALAKSFTALKRANCPCNQKFPAPKTTQTTVLPTTKLRKIGIWIDSTEGCTNTNLKHSEPNSQKRRQSETSEQNNRQTERQTINWTPDQEHWAKCWFFSFSANSARSVPRFFSAFNRYLPTSHIKFIFER